MALVPELVFLSQAEEFSCHSMHYIIYIVIIIIMITSKASRL